MGNHMTATHIEMAALCYCEGNEVLCGHLDSDESSENSDDSAWEDECVGTCLTNGMLLFNVNPGNFDVHADLSCGILEYTEHCITNEQCDPTTIASWRQSAELYFLC